MAVIKPTQADPFHGMGHLPDITQVPTSAEFSTLLGEARDTALTVLTDNIGWFIAGFVLVIAFGVVARITRSSGGFQGTPYEMGLLAEAENDAHGRHF